MERFSRSYRPFNDERYKLGQELNILALEWQAFRTEPAVPKKKGELAIIKQNEKQKDISQKMAMQLQGRISALAVNFTSKYNLREFVDDLKQECNIALFYALDTFDPKKIVQREEGCTHDFFTHFVVWAKARMGRYARMKGRSYIDLPEKVPEVAAAVYAYQKKHPTATLEEACEYVARSFDPDKPLKPKTVLAMVDVNNAQTISDAPEEDGEPPSYRFTVLVSRARELTPDAIEYLDRLKEVKTWVESAHNISLRDKYIFLTALEGSKNNAQIAQSVPPELRKDSDERDLSRERIRLIILRVLNLYRESIGLLKLKSLPKDEK